MPSGVPMATAIVVMMRLPMIGLSRPPAEPGGGVICVNTARDRPLKPSHKSTARISASQARPKIVAANARLLARTLRRRRASYSAMSGPHPRIEPHQHQPGEGEHDEGDDEQDKAEGDQRRGIDVTDRFGEFVGDGGRDRR